MTGHSSAHPPHTPLSHVLRADYRHCTQAHEEDSWGEIVDYWVGITTMTRTGLILTMMRIIWIWRWSTWVWMMMGLDSLEVEGGGGMRGELCDQVDISHWNSTDSDLLYVHQSSMPQWIFAPALCSLYVTAFSDALVNAIELLNQVMLFIWWLRTLKLWTVAQTYRLQEIT